MAETGRKSAVLYHYSCPDGVFAALAAHLYFAELSLPAVFIPNTVYNPVRADSIHWEEFEDVYLLDFIGPPGFVEKLSSRANHIIILDHHKTALEELSKSNYEHSTNITKIIDMKRSGATIAYDFFREKLLKRSRTLNNDAVESNPTSSPLKSAGINDAERIIQLFKFIEDGDLWRWSIPNSKAFHHGLKSMNTEFNVNLNPSVFDQLLTLNPALVVERGKDGMGPNQKLIDEVIEQSYEVSFGGGFFGHFLIIDPPLSHLSYLSFSLNDLSPQTFVMQAVDADGISDLRSDIGHQLAEKSERLGLRGIGAVVYKVPELGEGRLKVSLRSTGQEDTTPISQAFGGGGHSNASSFMVDSSQFESWRVNSVVANLTDVVGPCLQNKGPPSTWPNRLIKVSQMEKR